MRFYVPEWEDHVDADYDFETDEHSCISRSERNLAYIWDVFDRDPTATPIDGILISREQIEASPERAAQLLEHGIYNAPNDGTALAVPEWLPTISDCGAWGYKKLPFPPYGNAEMLAFYGNLNVDVGVTIDHLVLGSGHAARLYLNAEHLPEGYTRSDLPTPITNHVDVMIDSWPTEWPEYVTEYESSIVQADEPTRPIDDLLNIDLAELDPEDDASEREQRVNEHLRGIADDPRIVYRDDDMEFRYELTLANLREMRDLYEAEDYSFRLMCAIQGWDTSSYANATRAALSAGYDYIGIGGVAGSHEKSVKQYVSAVGEVIDDYEQAHTTRVDAHVFGFAKTGAFDRIGRSGMSSFDSASMLRSAWTGGQNYHLDTATESKRYDALRVRYPDHKGELAEAMDTALWSQEVLTALRAYDRRESIASAISAWYEIAQTSLENLEGHLRESQWSAMYEQERVRDMKRAFRTEYEYAGHLAANFSDRFRKRLLDLLQTDSSDDPVPFERYQELIDEARSRLDRFPRTIEDVSTQEATGTPEGSLETAWTVVYAYTAAMGDEKHRKGYRELLQNRPWDECDCPVCTELGIEVAIFRGNNRNRRRGFHNTRRFYDQFERELPKLLIITKGDTSMSGTTMVKEFLAEKRPELWGAVHDLPVVEIGVATANGIHEWWEESPTTLSFAPSKLGDMLRDHCARYQSVFIDGSNWDVSPALREELEAVECGVGIFHHPEELRRAVLRRLDYDERTLPPHPERESVDQIGIRDFDQ